MEQGGDDPVGAAPPCCLSFNEIGADDVCTYLP